LGAVPPRRRRPAARRLLALAAACALVAVALQILAVRTTEGQRLDDAARGNLSAASPTAVINATSELLDTISVASLLLLGVGIMAIALLRGRRLLALGAGVVVLGANVTTQILKQEVGRPDLLPSSLPNGSFPSGHVTVAMSLAMALVLVAPQALRWWAAAVGSAYAIGVGVAVVLLDWHRPSDVLGAYLVTVTWTALVAAALLSAPGAGGLAEDRPRRPAVAPAAGVLIVALGAVFGIIVGIEAARRLDLLRVVHDRTAFAAAAIVCAAACVLLTVVVTGLIQRGSSSPDRARAR
jgi:membrane-associated phospholipid phosphatase